MPSVLFASASITQPQLEALPAGTPEVLIGGYRQMATFTTGESPVPSGCHCLKLIARHAVRAPNRDQGHNYIHPHTFFALSFAAANILSVDDYRSVKGASYAAFTFADVAR
jgi:hypothetical protein